MAVIKTIQKGESLTIGFVLPESYNLANLEAVKIYIGSTIYAHEMDGRTVRVELESNQTALITGRNNIHFLFDDAIFGIKKILCGQLEVLPTQATFKDDSINTGYDVEIVLSIYIETVSVESVLYNTLKGDAATIEVGTTTTLEAGEDATVENVGNEHEAVFNFGIPQGIQGEQGIPGNIFQGEFNSVIDRMNLVWVDGWVWIDTGAKTNSKIIQVGYLAINIGQGTLELNPIINYPSSTTNLSQSLPNGFYIKDADNLLNEHTDFELLDIRYNILSDTNDKYDFKGFVLGNNVVLEGDNMGGHEDAMESIFFDIYPTFEANFIKAYEDPNTSGGFIDRHFTPTYAKTVGANLFFKPQTNGATTEEQGSNANILTVASHYNNTFARRDITASATTFLKNVIAIGSCPDEELPTIGTSYGFGLEFFEDNVKTSDEYPDYDYTMWNPTYQQSATSAIIAAKFRMIKDATGASWSVCRLAARMTARKTVGGVYASGFAWDMYRGFGIINVNDAVQYIEDNYKSLEYRTMLADQHDGLNGISPFITYPDFLPDSPLPKHIIDEQFVAKETGKSLILDTEISRLAGVTNQTLLGLGGEATANKQNSLAVDGTGVKFPTVDAVNTGLSGKQNTIGYTPENVANKKTTLTDSDTDYPTARTVRNTTISNERVVAESLTQLQNRIAALETLLQSPIFNTLQAESISAVKTLQYKGADIIRFGAGTPSFAPEFIGQIYVKTDATTAVYIATGIATSGNFKSV